MLDPALPWVRPKPAYQGSPGGFVFRREGFIENNKRIVKEYQLPDDFLAATQLMT